MLLKELLKELKNKAEHHIEWEGWNIAFYIKEEKDDYFVLSIKENLVEKASSFLQIRSSIWDLQPFQEIYERRLEISKQIESQSNLIDNRIQLYDDKLLNDIQRLKNLTEVPGLSIYFLHNNFSYIHFVEIKNFFSIKNLTLKKINGTKEIYFLGENGDGKSLILMGIYLIFNKSYIEKYTEKQYSGKILDMDRQNANLILKGSDINGLKYGNDKGVYLQNIFAYGVHRGRYSTDNAEQYGFMSLFDSDQELNNPVSWLKQLYVIELEKRITNNITGLAANMFEEKNLPTTIPLKVIQDLFYELLERNVTIEVKAEGVKFKEKGFDLTFEQLSEGYKNLIIWVSDLIFRLHKNQPGVEKLNELTGVVMVDEIELHLHPKWQRTLVSKLRNFFPNIQFIFTTHSPTIIQGASDEAIIYRVHRDNETGHTHVSEPYYKKDLDDLMFNSLVTSPLFGLEDARMTSKPVSPDTSDSYALSRINKRVEAQLATQKKNGKKFFTDKEIDDLIDQILNEELSHNDKDK